MVKNYRATKRNTILLESAMKELGIHVDVNMPVADMSAYDYQAFKYSYWYYTCHHDVNAKMQELEHETINAQ